MWRVPWGFDGLAVDLGSFVGDNRRGVCTYVGPWRFVGGRVHQNVVLGFEVNLDQCYVSDNQMETEQRYAK